jgi:hypothetical protein
MSPETHITIGTQSYEKNTPYISWPYGNSSIDIRELEKLKLFPELRGVSFSDCNLDDKGLSIVCEIPGIENLNLQGTEITNDGLSKLKKLPLLKDLRLKENSQLTNSCIPHLKQIRILECLQIQETSIDQKGINSLVGMPSLNWIVLSLDDENFNYEELLKLSLAIPDCEILAKGNGIFMNGTFSGTWKK